MAPSTKRKPSTRRTKSSTTTVANKSAADSKPRWKYNALGESCVIPAPRWTAAEVQQLRQLLQDYCARKQITEQELFRGTNGGKMHRTNNNNNNNNNNDDGGGGGDESAWIELARAFPARQVEAVYKKAYRDYQNRSHTYTRGRWSDEEVSRLFQLVALHGTKWSKLALLLNRTPDSCFDKYRENKGDFERGPWTPAEMEKLKALVAEYTAKDPHQPLPMAAISRKMETRSRLSCYFMWEKIQLKESLDDSNKKKGNQKAKSRPTPERTPSARVPETTISTTSTTAAAADTYDDNHNDDNEGDDDSSSLTLRDVSKAMKKILKKAPQQQMKKKALKHAVQAKFPTKQRGHKKQVKKWIKQLLSSTSLPDNGGQQQQQQPPQKQRFKLDGKMVSLIQNK
eukprot:scaffold936_cov106-Amphora_coffeaeformis.AAC.12